MMTSIFLPPAAPALAAPPLLPDDPPEARPATTPTTSPIRAMTATSDSENFSRVLAMRILLLPRSFVPSVPQPRKRFLERGHCRPVTFRCQEITFSSRMLYSARHVRCSAREFAHEIA